MIIGSVCVIIFSKSTWTAGFIFLFLCPYFADDWHLVSLFPFILIVVVFFVLKQTPYISVVKSVILAFCGRFRFVWRFPVKVLFLKNKKIRTPWVVHSYILFPPLSRDNKLNSFVFLHVQVICRNNKCFIYNDITGFSVDLKITKICFPRDNPIINLRSRHNKRIV